MKTYGLAVTTSELYYYYCTPNLSCMQVVRTHATTLSGTVITPLYGIIPPRHDFTRYNRERATSGAAVSLFQQS